MDGSSVLRKINILFFSNYNQNYKVGAFFYHFCLFLRTKVCKKWSVASNLWIFFEKILSPLLVIGCPLLMSLWSNYGVLPPILRQTDPFSILPTWTWEFKTFIIFPCQRKTDSFLSRLLSLFRCMHTPSLSKTLFFPQGLYCPLQINAKGLKAILLMILGEVPFPTILEALPWDRNQKLWAWIWEFIVSVWTLKLSVWALFHSPLVFVEIKCFNSIHNFATICTESMKYSSCVTRAS